MEKVEIKRIAKYPKDPEGSDR